MCLLTMLSIGNRIGNADPEHANASSDGKSDGSNAKCLCYLSFCFWNYDFLFVKFLDRNDCCLVSILFRAHISVLWAILLVYVWISVKNVYKWTRQLIKRCLNLNDKKVQYRKVTWNYTTVNNETQFTPDSHRSVLKKDTISIIIWLCWPNATKT